MTSEGEILFKTIGDVSGGGGGGGGGGDDMESIVRQGVERMYDFCPEPFNIIEIESRIKDNNPFVVCALQEAMRMTDLLVFMKRSLEELTLGLDGALNMSPAMEEVQMGIYKNSVPPSWMKQMSTRVQEVYSLSRWYRDVQERHAQLDKWTTRNIEHPKTVWLPGLFNAKALITAVQQVYARANQLPLDVMGFMTEVTKLSPGDITEYAEKGAYIHGLTMEGARWDVAEGTIKDSKPKELRCHVTGDQRGPGDQRQARHHGVLHVPGVHEHAARERVLGAGEHVHAEAPGGPAFGEVDARVRRAADARRARGVSDEQRAFPLETKHEPPDGRDIGGNRRGVRECTYAQAIRHLDNL